MMDLPSTRRVAARRGFSLLEVILATGILAASTVLLLRLFWLGETHGRKGEHQVIAQMLCQSIMDELVTGVLPLEKLDEEPVPGYPNWFAAVDWEEAEIPGLIRLTVRVNHVPFRPEVANAPSDRTPAESRKTITSDQPPTFELDRWWNMPPQASNKDADHGVHEEPPSPVPGTP